MLGKYSLHFHLVGASMRGSSVIGASIWDSGNRWITIHGTDYLVVRDCVGYRSVGHGFYLEDGSEAYNVLDRNLAVQAFAGKPLPAQFLPFDHNDGAGFWWANSHEQLHAQRRRGMRPLRVSLRGEAGFLGSSGSPGARARAARSRMLTSGRCRSSGSTATRSIRSSTA